MIVDKKIKKLLELMLDNIDNFSLNIRLLNRRLFIDGLISKDEYTLICDFLDKNKPVYKDSSTQIKWLKEEIEKIK